MANLQVKDAAAATKYLAASGAGTDIDPHIVEHEVTQATADDLKCDANLQVADADVGAGNPVPVSDAGGSLTVDDGGTPLEVDATGQGDVPITLDGETVTIQDGGNTITVDDGDTTLSVDDGGGALTVDGTVTADAGTGPWPVTDNSGSLTVDDGGTSLTVDGTVTAQLSPQTSGGLSIFRSIDLDESEEEVKATAGQLFGFYLYNDASSGKRYVKFYNGTAASVVVGTTTPVITIPLDAGQGCTVEFTNGIAFSTAITVAATTGVLDSDTGAPGANEVIANVFYK